MTTILDVARRVAVSTATVSRVLSKPEQVAEGTRERVLAAIAEMSYEPNRAARTLRTRRTSKLLVTVPDISNPFFASVIRGAEEAARDAGYSVVLGDTRHDASLENQYAAMLTRREVDGLVFRAHTLPDALRKMIQDGQGQAPLVNGCEYSPDLGVSSVHIDNHAAAAEALAHLFGLGHRRIGVITGPLISPISRDRLAGVKEAAQRVPAAKLTVRFGDFSVQSGFEQGRSLLTEGVTAIFCFSDEMAIGVLGAIRGAGLSCPQDISVVGFDDIRFSEYLTPPLTTIAQPTVEIGRATIELLLRTLAGDVAKPEILTLPHRLIVRASTGRARA